MTSYSLKQVSASTYEITSNRRKIGFVNKCPAGFVARIGKHCETATSAEQAFRLTVAKALGFATPYDLAAHNQRVRAENAVVRQAARYVVDQAINHKNFEPMVDMLVGKKK